MPEVSHLWRMVLGAMPTDAWTTPAALSNRLGLDIEATTDLLASLDEAGLVVVSEPVEADGPVAMPSPRGIEATRRSHGRSTRDRALVGAGGWSASPDYRPSRPRISATAAGSVTS